MHKASRMDGAKRSGLSYSPLDGSKWALFADLRCATYMCFMLKVRFFESKSGFAPAANVSFPPFFRVLCRRHGRDSDCHTGSTLPHQSAQIEFLISCLGCMWRSDRAALTISVTPWAKVLCPHRWQIITKKTSIEHNLAEIPSATFSIYINNINYMEYLAHICYLPNYL
jgi:hypothetical protein